MTTKEIYSQLALRVYDAAFENVVTDESNRPRTPAGWTEDWRPDNETGFSVGIYRNTSTGAVVVAFTGTNGQFGDWLENFNYSTEQLQQAAVIAASVIDRYGANNVSFTGHSLGGGLASVMAVWFDRPATVFDQRPMQAIALNPQNWLQARDRVLQAGFSIDAFENYNPAINFFSRETRVTHFFTEGEVLQPLRAGLEPIEGAGQVTSIQFGAEQLDLGPVDNAVALHSQALLTAGLLSDSFRQATITVQATLPVVLDDEFYAYTAATSTQRNFLIDLIRSERGIRVRSCLLPQGKRSPLWSLGLEALR